MGTDPSARREQRTALTGENSSTVRSPAVRSSPLDSPQPRASNGRPSWPGGSSEQAQRRPWLMIEVGGSMLAISSYNTLRKGGLLPPGDLEELHGIGGGSGWRR